MIRYVLKTLGSFRSTLVVGVGLPFLIAASANAQAPSTKASPSVAPIAAQVPNAPAVATAGEATAERVIVTGSYIPTAETESALPVTVYTAEVMTKQGAQTPVEAIRQLPSFVGNAATENDSNGGDGTATVNLRALGSANVLILINGRRTFNFNDINLIPIGAVSRTEILKDGASAIYGSDAVAGVVNFILLDGPGEKPYEGAELFALYGNTTDTDSHIRQVYIKGGVTGLDGKVSIAASGEYYSRANLYSKDRFAVAGTANLTNQVGLGLGLGGLNNNSPTYGGRVSVLASASNKYPQYFNLVPGGPTTGTPGQLTLLNLGDNQANTNSYRLFDGDATGGSGTDPSRFNFRTATPAIPAIEKAIYFVTGRYKIFGDGLQVYGDIMYSKSKQDNGLAGAPFSITSAGNGRATAQASQFNPFGNDLSSVRYRLTKEIGSRRSFFDKDAWRYIAGINGDFNFKDNGFISHFGYDSGFLYERFDELRIDSGDATRSNLLGAIAGTLVPGKFFNIFIGQNAPAVGTAPTYVNGVPTGLTAAYDNVTTGRAASYIGHSEFYERDYLYDAKINAHLFPNLWDGGWDFAAGYEHRNSAQHSVPDPVQAAGNQLGFNQAPNFKYLQEVDSFFTELTVPLVTSTMNVPFVRSLDLSLAWRYEKFNDRDQGQPGTTGAVRKTGSFDNSNPNEDFGGTPRVSLRYQPIADVTLRASWGQSFRSPSPNGLFSPINQNFPQLFDPYKKVTLQPPDGVWQGGNPNLTPEKTDAYSAGVVWTPKFLPGFTMTMDWYQVFTKDLILSSADFAQLELTQNGNSGNTKFLDPDGCGGGSGSAVAPGGPALGITRFADGSLDCIDSLNANAGKRLVQGIDITAVYEIPTERFGKFTISGGYNHFFTWKAEPIAGAGTHNFLGDYNNGTIPLAPGGVPFNKAFLRGEWEWRNFDFVSTGNYVGDYQDDPGFIFGNTQIGGTDSEPTFKLHRTVTSYITLDMQLSYEWKKPVVEAAPSYAKDAKDGKNVMATRTDAASSSIWQRMLWGTRLTVGVNDVFDRQPPTVLGAFNDNYDTSNYSIRNRYWYVSLDKKF